MANGDTLLERHVNEGALNAQYISKFSAVMLMESIDSWVNSKLLESLKSSPILVRISAQKRSLQYASENKKSHVATNVLRCHSASMVC